MMFEEEREYQRKWREDNPEKVKEQNRKWREANPEKHRENVKKWGQDNPEKVKEYDRKWREANLEKVNESQRKRQKTPAGKIAAAKSQAKRKRELDYIPLNNWFKGCAGHHIDKEQVLFMPEELHKSIWHSQNIPETMVEINNAAFEWIATQEIL